MRAIVVSPFKGVKDGEVYPRSWKPGEIVEGDLAASALAEGHAALERQERAATASENKAVAAAPQNKARGGRFRKS